MITFYFTQTKSNINKSDHIIVVLHGFELFDKVYEYEQVHAILIIDFK
jgi:hypothetical protein